MCFILFWGYAWGLAACSVGLLLFLLLWTLAPHDYVIYCQARGLRGHASPRGECACFFLEDSVPLEAEQDQLLLSWLNSKWAHLVHCEEIFYSKLELLTPLWQVVLGLHCSATVHAARRRFTLLGDGSQLVGNSSRWSDHEFDCSALFAPTRTSSRRHCTTGTRRSGTSCGGGATPDTHGRPHGLCPKG